MNALNSILLEGNLVRDPSSKVLPSGMPVCDFVVASNRTYKQNEAFEKEVSYFDVEAWSRLGSACAQNLTRGRGVRVVGRLKQDRWLDSQGKQRSRIKIVAEHVEFKPLKSATGQHAESAIDVDDGRNPSGSAQDAPRYTGEAQASESEESDAVF